MVGTKYKTSRRPTIMQNSFGDSAEIYNDGSIVIRSGSDGSVSTRKKGSRPEAVRNFLGGPGGWRIIEG